jgi:hypothetical protein
MLVTTNTSRRLGVFALSYFDAEVLTRQMMGKEAAHTPRPLSARNALAPYAFSVVGQRQSHFS